MALTALGRDKRGLIAELSGAVTDLGGNVIHVDQSSIYGFFLLFMLIEPVDLPPGLDIYRFAYELTLRGRDAGVEVRADVAPRDLATKAKDVRVVTIVGSDKPGVMRAFTKTIADQKANIERMHHVAQGQFMAFEIWIDVSEADFEALREALRKTGERIGVDAVIQPHSMFRTRKRLVVFDMDSTIVDGEVIDELARAAGVEPAVADITARAMNGELDFAQALHARVAMLKGLTVEDLDRVAGSLRLNPGTEDLVRTLKEMGFRVALVSGGFTHFTDHLKREMGFDYTFANQLTIKDGVLTGEVEGDIIDRERKGVILQELADKEGLRLDEVVAVGDGANDQIMIQNAGLGIAFNAKEILKKAADGSVSRENLKGILYALGATDYDLKRAGIH